MSDDINQNSSKVSIDMTTSVPPSHFMQHQRISNVSDSSADASDYAHMGQEHVSLFSPL